MSIKKHNIKRRMVMGLALAMLVALLAAGPAQAQDLSGGEIAEKFNLEDALERLGQLSDASTNVLSA